jgi:hypothetical protein
MSRCIRDNDAATGSGSSHAASAAAGLLALVLAGLAAHPASGATGLSTPASAPTTMPASAPAAPVPDALLGRLTAQYVSPDSDRSAADKVRRYRTMLREGRETLRRFPDADNLYQVQSLMLQAGKGLLLLGVDEIDLDEMLALARGVADSSASPAWRIQPDVLLLQVRLAQLLPDRPDPDDADAPPPGAEEALRDFLDRYGSTDVEVAAHIQVADLARDFHAAQLRREAVQWLRENISAPGAAEYLRTQGIVLNLDRTAFRRALTTPEGKSLVFPRDALGKEMLVAFWSSAAPRLRNGPGGLSQWLQGNRHRAVVAGFDLNESVRAFEAARKAQNIRFPLIHLAQGAADPVAQIYDLRELPTFFFITPTGWIRRVGTRGYDSSDWGRARNEFAQEVETGWRRRERVLACRSGEFLLRDLLTGEQPSPAATALWRAVEDARLAKRTFLERVEDYRRIHEQAGALARKEPDPATSAQLLGARLILSQWLALAAGDADRQAEALQLADQPWVGQAPPAIGVLARYVKLRAEVSAKPLSVDWRPTLRAFWETEATGASPEAAHVLAAMLASEAGDRDLWGRAERGISHDPVLRRKFQGIWRLIFYQGSLLGRPVTGTYRLADGGSVSLADDLRGKPYILHVYSRQVPPGTGGDFAFNGGRPSTYEVLSAPNDQIRVVGLCIDRDPAALAEAQRLHPDWLNLSGERGWDDPILRDFDLTTVPHAWIVGEFGTLLATGENGNHREYLRQAFRNYARNAVRFRDARTWMDCVFRFHRAAQILGTLKTLGDRRTLEEIKHAWWIGDYNRAAQNLAAGGVRYVLDASTRQPDEILKQVDHVDLRRSDWRRRHNVRRINEIRQTLQAMPRAAKAWDELVRSEELWPAEVEKPEQALAPAAAGLDTLSFPADQLTEKRRAVLDALFVPLGVSDGKARYSLRRPDEQP